MSERVLELDSRTERPRLRLVSVDVLIVFALCLLAASPLGDVFVGSRWLIAIAGGLAIGFAVAAAALVLRLGPWMQTLLLTVVYLVLGSALAIPQWTIAGVIPTPDSLYALIVDFVRVWRDSLTAASPLPNDGAMLLLPLVTGIVAATAATSFLWRSRWPQVAGLVVLGLFCFCAAFGDSGAQALLPRGLGLCIATVLWIRFRAMRTVRANWTRRVGMAGAVVGLAAGVGAAAGFVPHGNRDVLRDHVVPPLAVEDFASPLSAYRAFTAEDKRTGYADRHLFTLSPTPRNGQILRLAVMDQYNGVVWNVGSNDDANAGTASFTRLPVAPTRNATTSVTVADYATFRPGNFQNAWVPAPGAVAASMERTLLRNADTGTLLAVHDGEVGVAPGDRFTLQSTPHRGIDIAPRGIAVGPHPRAHDCVNRSLERQIKAAGTVPGAAPARTATAVPALAQQGRKWLQEAPTTAGATVLLLCNKLKTEGKWASGNTTTVPSAPGHSLRRMEEFAKGPSGHANELIGDDEQYASALALLTQSLGIPARVVLGFVDNGDGVIQGRDARAWTEALLNLRGEPTWVPFFASATKNPRQVDTPDNKPAPQVLQPPKLPQTPDDADQNSPRSSSNRGFDWRAIVGFVWAAMVVTTKAAFWTFPLWGIILLKVLRRRRRKAHSDLASRVSGGWREVTDTARDLGTRLPASNTRFENSVQLSHTFPQSSLGPLGAVADRHVFGPVKPTEEEAAAYWADVETALKRMRHDAPWWRRHVAVLSPASVPWAALLGAVRQGATNLLDRVARVKPITWIITKVRATATRTRRSTVSRKGNG